MRHWSSNVWYLGTGSWASQLNHSSTHICLDARKLCRLGLVGGQEALLSSREYSRRHRRHRSLYENIASYPTYCQITCMYSSLFCAGELLWQLLYRLGPIVFCLCDAQCSMGPMHCILLGNFVHNSGAGVSCRKQPQSLWKMSGGCRRQR